MLTTIRFLIDTAAAFEWVLIFLSITVIPDNRIVKFIRKYPGLQIAFAFILAFGTISAIAGRYGF